ncbi:MAG: ABC transporter ATP-binding protein/permease [Oscillospiraceae bacterium]|nr:ABC transporter ATP-binding protein/permease [Oscillospiraceae bacterium]
MIKITKHLEGKDWQRMFIKAILIVIIAWFELEIPKYMSEITRVINTPDSTINEIWRAGISMLICAFASMLFTIAMSYFTARISTSISSRLRALLYGKVESFSMSEINKFSIPSLITRTTNDVQQVTGVYNQALQMLVRSPITFAIALSRIIGYDARWTNSTIIAATIMTVSMICMMRFVLPRFRLMQTYTDNLNRVTRENLNGIRVVRAYNAETYEEAKFEKANHELTSTNLFTTRMMGLMMPVNSLVSSGLNLAIYWIGAFLISAAVGVEKVAIFSTLVVFTNYAMQVISSFTSIINIFNMIPRAQISANRINEVLDTEATIIDGDVMEGLPGLFGEIEFRNVSFKYHDSADYVLKDISFTAKKGETVAFIGSTGSGKSSLIYLIPRFYDVTEGEVLVDGVNVKDYNQEALLNKIGYVSQTAVIFNGTVASNVAFGSNGKGDYTYADVMEAVRVAQGQEFVENMHGQYDGMTSQGGTNLSGGQKQRVSIARAVCRDPEIFIFDDSFSALDYRTDRQLRSELKKQTSGATSLIVAQRIGTIMDADKIVVLDEGMVMGIGTHKELLQTCAVYREIAGSQLSEEELAS